MSLTHISESIDLISFDDEFPGSTQIAVGGVSDVFVGNFPLNPSMHDEVIEQMNMINTVMNQVGELSAEQLKQFNQKFENQTNKFKQNFDQQEQKIDHLDQKFELKFDNFDQKLGVMLHEDFDHFARKLDARFHEKFDHFEQKLYVESHERFDNFEQKLDAKFHNIVSDNGVDVIDVPNAQGDPVLDFEGNDSPIPVCGRIIWPNPLLRDHVNY